MRHKRRRKQSEYFLDLKFVHNMQISQLHRERVLHDVYTGFLKDGKPHGIGRLIDCNFRLYEGQFEEGKPIGFGRITKVYLYEFNPLIK